MTDNWKSGNVLPWWQNQHRGLSYIHEPFNNPDDLVHWRDLGYTQTRFTGDMYDMRQAEPDWIAPFRDQFPMEHFSWSMYCMRPGDVIPNHGDTYQRFCQLHGVDNINSVQRIVVFMESWQSGHYFEIESAPVIRWAAGDWISWQGDTRHLAANMGQTNRYTLQLTGLVNSK